MDTTTSTAISGAWDTGASGILTFFTGTLLGKIIVLVVVGVAVGLMIRQFKKRSSQLAGH